MKKFCRSLRPSQREKFNIEVSIFVSKKKRIQFICLFKNNSLVMRTLKVLLNIFDITDSLENISISDYIFLVKKI